MYEKELIGLSDSGARYLVIGGIALGFHRYIRGTLDLDLLPDLDDKNLDKIIKTLTLLGYKPRVPVDPNELKDAKKRELWYKEKNMKVFTFVDNKNQINAIDLMIYTHLNFDECFKRKKIINLENREIYVASAKDLLELKKVSARDKDLYDIKVLEKIVERENEQLL